MTIGQYARMALRESRRSRGRIGLFMACIAVGVAAVVLIAGLSNSVTEGIRAQGRRLLAADVVVEGRRALPVELDDLLTRFGSAQSDPAWQAHRVQRANVQEFVSVVLAAGSDASQLAELKVVQGEYPFYGGLVLEPPRGLPELLTPETVVVAPELLERLGVKRGDALRIGGADFRVAGMVVEEPDKLSITFTLGPRVFMSPEGLARTALLDRGARVEHRAMLKLPPGTSAEDASRLERQIEAELPNAEFYRVRTFTEAQPALRRSFDRMGRYLGLVGLLSLLVGGVGVAQVARAWLAGRMDDIAIMRCLGATPREVVILFFAQVVSLALVASLMGAAAGSALLGLAPTMLEGLMPADLFRAWQPQAIVRGLLLGIAVAIIFTLPLLLGLRRVPPVRVLRRDAEPVRAGWIAQGIAAAIILGGVWAAATTQAESLKYGSIFIGGLIASVLFLALAAAAVSRIARLLPRDSGGVRLRHGLTHLARPGAATIGAIVALGLGVTFVFATRVVERHLSDQLRSEQPANAPTTFLLDIQPDQWRELEGILHRHGATGVDAKPIVTARFAAIDGVAVGDLRQRRREQLPDGQSGEQPRPRGGRLMREIRITYGDALPEGNRVIEGEFPAGPSIANGVSVQDEYARDIGVEVGSTITLDVQGVPVDLRVTSLRTIDWRTFGLNFFLFAEPGPLDAAPQMRVATARIPAELLSRVQADIVRALPNVTVIHIRDVMDKVLAVLGNLSLAVRSLGLFTILAGVVVLGGTVAATQARRAREVALLKTIGMTRRDVAAVFAIEYGLTGLVAAVVGIAAGLLLARGVLTQLMELPWSPSVMEMFMAVAITVALAVAAGLVASARALSAKPIEVLRSE